MGRNATGVRGVSLADGNDEVVGMVCVDENSNDTILVVSENGYGKRTPIADYTRHGRGTKGMIAIQQSERNGKVVAATLVRPEDEIMLITDTGVLVRANGGRVVIADTRKGEAPADADDWKGKPGKEQLFSPNPGEP